MIKYYLKLLAFRLSPFLVALGINKLVWLFTGARGHILMFHRVVPKDQRKRIHNHLSLEITPEKLREIISFFIKHNYDVISLDQIEKYRQSNKKFVVFSFDDGYKDNLLFAYPIFKEFGCPFTIFVQNSFPNGDAFIWWYLLEDFLLQQDNISIKTEKFTLEVSVDSIKKKEAVFYKIRDAINNGSLPLDKFREILTKKGVDWKAQLKGYSLTWEEIISLSNDPLVTIGAHTVSHRALKSLSEEQAYAEILKSRDELELRLQKKVRHFAYPFGSRKEVSARDVMLVSQLGFDTAVTTILGNINKYQETTQLPRITINALTSLSVLKMQVSGLYSLFDNGFRGYKV
ncbi:Polysaccharide deacetylase [Saccharicrinis carchari]|uniref:Polysaccharide deacetylase n=1 Tax=Saccharicrinis carchari TaxID=1168039 RepID=A0A521BRE2_SACCC|nr:polysaccharide deacetylase family protein [Saccharicrinis carchari]SMO49738.1 Polysaccharide deacetylase [Saccharicrinis carchari]